MSKQKKGKIKWAYFTERLASDFPFLIVYYFFIAHSKYLKFKNLLYLGKYPNIYSYRGEKELERFYQRIKKFKKKDFLKVAKETKALTDELNLWLRETTFKNLKEYSNIELEKNLESLTNYFINFWLTLFLSNILAKLSPIKMKFLVILIKKHYKPLE